MASKTATKEKWVGKAMKRKEDPRLIQGLAHYVDDISLPGMLHAAVVRSPYAHARLGKIDTGAAANAPGVVAVLTGEDTKGKLGSVPVAADLPDLRVPPHPPLADGKVRYVGEPVAVVVADKPYRARDAADLVEVDYEPLDAVTDPEKALAKGAPLLHEQFKTNQACVWKLEGGFPDKAFNKAHKIVRQRLVNQRLIPVAMETRGVLASYDAGSEQLTVWSATQIPHLLRTQIAVMLSVPEMRVRVIAPEVGGGFGSKLNVYAEEALVAHLAIKLGRPVKWIETRRENFLNTIHGRDQINEVEIAVAKDGRLLALKCRLIADFGAYHQLLTPLIPTLTSLLMLGAYKIPAVSIEYVGVFTNKMATDAYRGAGRPEATFLIERMVDRVAQELGKDPAEIRRKNFPRPKDFPYATPTGVIYDSGDYEMTLDTVLEHVDYQELRREQAHLREHGQYMGIGVTCYAEICGLGPSQVAGAVGFGGGLWESATVRFSPTGKASIFTGTSPHGQGEETTFAQILGDELGLPVEDIDVVHGDTSNTPMGWGTYGSRTTVVGGGALALAARKIKEKAKLLAAHLLEAADADIEYEDGKFFVRGSPDQSKTIQDIALMANVAWNMPEGMEPGLEASAFYDPPNFTYPFGTHVAVVMVDPDNGHIELRSYLAVDDCGKQVNPMIVEGQVQGGVVQGAGQALWEGAVYDENGQLLTGSMMDYVVPRAHMVPDIETLSTVTPSPHNPLGVKGIGETGTIASTVTVYNAVMDALKPLGVTHLDIPLTSERVWQAINQRG